MQFCLDEEAEQWGIYMQVTGEHNNEQFFDWCLLVDVGTKEDGNKGVHPSWICSNPVEEDMFKWEKFAGF